MVTPARSGTAMGRAARTGGKPAGSPSTTDRRARLLLLTPKGQACTVAADAAAADVVRQWRDQLPEERFGQLQQALHALAVPGRLRPAW